MTYRRKSICSSATTSFGGATRWLALSSAIVMAVTLTGEVPAMASGPAWRPPVPAEVAGVGLTPIRHTPRPVWTAREVLSTATASWPAPGSAIVDLTGVSSEGKAGPLPVFVVRGTGDSAVHRTGVRLFDRRETAKAGVSGLLLHVSRADGVPTRGVVTLRVDYSAFANAFGGDWATRLRFVSIPDGTPLPSANNAVASTVSAQVTLAADGSATMLAVTAGPAGDNGDYTATSLSPASTWQVSAQTGDFAWSYPLRMVPGVGGPEPSLSLAYSSGSIDGRTGGTNTQGSWVGDGWDLWPGFIERRYKSCSDDKDPVGGVDPNNKSVNGGDQCWLSAAGNATMSLNGRATELVKSVGNTWRGVADDGSRIELLADTSLANGDDNGEFWKVTTIDGVQYFFGRNFGPGGASATTPTKSTWTSPVYGNHPGEPGYTAGDFAASRRTQAWRWNLDYVVDPHGNTMTYFYVGETGAYGREGDASKRTTYDRGGHLARIEYGNRSDAASTVRASAQVVFDVADRCASSCYDASGNPVPASWPDTPWDQYCKAAPCTEALAPTYWTGKRLSRIRSQVYSGSGTTYNEVEWRTLRHTYLFAGTNEGKPMWLAGVTRTGKVTSAGGSEVSDPEIVFSPGADALANRVDGPADGRSNLFRYRISTITTESGAQISPTYSSIECVRTSLPAPHANGKRCFPQYYAPDGVEPTLDWFHKYVVTRVDVYDNTGAFEHEQTNYDYLDTPAWHHDDSELVEPKKRTWGQYHGYGRVRIRKGLESGVQSATEYLYLRGMDGDKQPIGTRDVWVTDSQGRAVEDHEAYSGMTLEETTLLGAGGSWVSGTVNTPVVQGPTATAGPLKAWMPNTGTVRVRTLLWNGTTQWTKTVTSFNTDNLPTQVDDLGNEASAADDKCTRTWYARNPSNWMLEKVKRVETVGVGCGTTPVLPDDMLSSTRTTYDADTNNWDTYLPAKGDVTKTEEISSWSGTMPVWLTTTRSTYDVNGRVTEARDALDRPTTTAYTPAITGPVTATTVTNPLGHAVTSMMAPAWHLPTSTLDNANSARTDLTYDGLGRLLKVWMPGRAMGVKSPHLEFSYMVRNAVYPSAVTIKKLLPVDNTYKTSISLYDGLLRLRQTQTQAPGGGRVVADTIYNSRGLAESTSKDYYDSSGSPPDTILAGNVDMRALTENVYDGAGRTAAAIFKVSGIEKWRTTTSYGGDRTTVIPPLGGTKTETLVDARDRLIERRQYHSRTASTFDRTRYTYSDRDELVAVIDAAGNTWRYTYDQRGRKIRDEDPDKGITTSTYDPVGQLTTVTDARGVTLAHTYDALGRKTSLRDGSVTGAERAEWVYDTLPNGVGKLTRSVRYQPAGSTNVYVNEVSGYDSAGRPTGSRVIIPASEGGLCAASGVTSCTYSHATTYHADGQTATSTIPAAANLPSEQLRFLYNDIGSPTAFRSSLQIYVSEASYDKLGHLTQRVLGEDGKHTWLTYTIDQTTDRLVGANAVPELKPEVFNFSYSYDHAGNVTKIADTPNSGQVADIQCYTYDYLRRLTEAWTPSSGDCNTVPTISGLGGPATYWHTYTYDVTGNRLTERRHAATDQLLTFIHPAAGGTAGSKPHAVSRIDFTGPVTKTQNFGYDAAGNTTCRPSGSVANSCPTGTGTQSLSWDNEGHLATSVDSTSTTSYLYDADGNRLIRRDPTGATLYLPGGTEVRKPTSGTAVATRYYTHVNATIAVRTGSSLHWLCADHHNTAEAAINNADLSVARRRTLPFGETRGNPSGTWPSTMDKGFVGGTNDNTGLTHLGAREYDRFIGAFISVDQIIDHNDPQQIHGYSYANNNPTTMTDPDGRCVRLDDINAPCTGSKNYEERQAKHEASVRRRVARRSPFRNRPTAPSTPTGYAKIWYPMLWMSQEEIDSRHKVINDMNVFEALSAWATGAGGVQKYYQVDEMTLAVRRSGHMSGVREVLGNIIGRGDYRPEGSLNFSLPYGDDDAAAGRLAADAIALGAGVTGDAEKRARATVAAIGSFHLTYRIMSVDGASGRAVVAFEASNTWSVESATRIPIGSRAGQGGVSGPTSGPMGPVQQFWYWAEVIDF